MELNELFTKHKLNKTHFSKMVNKKRTTFMKKLVRDLSVLKFTLDEEAIIDKELEKVANDINDYLNNKNKRRMKSRGFKQSITLAIRGREYEINSPTPEQFMAIQEMKSLITDGRVDQLPKTGRDGVLAFELVNMQANFKVLIPDLESDLGCKIADLELSDSFELLRVFNEVFVPWSTKNTNILVKERMK